jgi:periplasmic protein TonB
VIGLLALLIGAAGPAAISVPAKLVAGTITSDDYPPGALSRNASGVTMVRLTITTQGRAIGCSVHRSSGDAELDAKTCFVATYRMRFSPALGHDGKPVPMAAILPVRWEIDPAVAPGPSNPE